MSHAYIIFFDKAVFEDLKSIPGDIREKILATIRFKLRNNPVMYGERLRKSLKGYWKLKYSSYRVVYSINDRRIHIHGIHKRSDDYKTIISRLT